MKAHVSPSTELLAAQERLLALRTSLPTRPPVQVEASPSVTPKPSLLQRGQALLIERRRREALRQKRQASDALKAALSPPSTPPLEVQVIETAVTSSQSVIHQGDAVKVYPDLVVGMLSAGLAAPGRVYWLLRYIDKLGRGWVTVASAREILTGNGATLRICGWRRLRQLLNQGEGVFWKRDAHSRIWLLGAAKIAENLAVSRLTGNPVAIPVKTLLGGIQAVRAHFYASFHSGRRQQNPITRQTLRQLTHVPERTQQDYDRVARVKRQRNLTVGEPFIRAKVEDRAWKQGRAVFHFIDVQGKHGPARCEYIAWHLPNSYHGPHAQRLKGRQKKLNRQLVDLVMKGMRGNGQATVEKVFWPTGAAAARAYNRHQDNDTYWQHGRNRRKSFTLWYVLPGESNRIT